MSIPPNSSHSLKDLQRLPGASPGSTTTQQLEIALSAISLFDQAWKQNHPHEAEKVLEWGVTQCEAFLQPNSAKVSEDRTVVERLIYACLILESEWLTRASPWEQMGSSKRLDKYFKMIPDTVIPVSEKLYAEGRVYSALPSFYGQDIKKSLVALEMLKRLEKNSELSEPWIERIRKGQGKWRDVGEDNDKFPIYIQRKETDGLGVRFYPSIYAGFPQGLGLQVTGQDSALWDTQRRIQGRAFVTHRGSVGLQGKYEDFEMVKGLKLGVNFQYLHGIQEYHGLGIDSPKTSMDFYIDRGVSDIHFQKNILGPTYLKLGWRFHSSHLRKMEGGVLDSNLTGLSNAFDSGVLAELGYDTRDSEFESYHGQRFLLQGYFPRENVGSSRSFDRFLMLAESFWALTTNLHLKIQGFYSSVSEAAPFDWYSSLSGTVSFSGLRPTRYVDRSLLGAGAELRWKRWQPFTVFGYVNSATLAHETNHLMAQNKKVGGGGGAELYLLRFRNRAVRIEAGNFGGEWNFTTMLGIPLD